MERSDFLIEVLADMENLEFHHADVGSAKMDLYEWVKAELEKEDHE